MLFLLVNLFDDFHASANRDKPSGLLYSRLFRGQLNQTICHDISLVASSGYLAKLQHGYKHCRNDLLSESFH